MDGEGGQQADFCWKRSTHEKNENKVVDDVQTVRNTTVIVCSTKLMVSSTRLMVHNTNLMVHSTKLMVSSFQYSQKARRGHDGRTESYGP